MVEAYLGLGSNIGDRVGFLKAAIEGLGSFVEINILEISSMYLTDPVGPVVQDAYLNAVVRIDTSMPPMDLLNAALAVERDCGRLRKELWGPRTLDIDIILYGNLKIKNEALIVPHPVAKERAFVLAPLVELFPGAMIDGSLAFEQLEKIGRSGVKRLIDFNRSEKVGIIGASSKPDRLSNLAQKMLMESGHSVVPISYKDDQILGVPCIRRASDYPGRLDTITLYLSPKRQKSALRDLVESNPKRVIFNPGSESHESQKCLVNANIAIQNTCTLMLLRTGQFS